MLSIRAHWLWISPHSGRNVLSLNAGEIYTWHLPRHAPCMYMYVHRRLLHLEFRVSIGAISLATSRIYSRSFTAFSAKPNDETKYINTVGIFNPKLDLIRVLSNFAVWIENVGLLKNRSLEKSKQSFFSRI